MNQTLYIYIKSDSPPPVEPADERLRRPTDVIEEDELDAVSGGGGKAGGVVGSVMKA